MDSKVLQEHVERAKLSKAYHKKPGYIKPLDKTDIIEKLYKKQVVDKPKHLEVEEKKKVEAMGSGVKANVFSSVKAKLPKKEGGAMQMGKPIKVVGSIPVVPKINGESQVIYGTGKMANRNAKVKEIMKSKKLSMTEASKYIKANNIKY